MEKKINRISSLEELASIDFSHLENQNFIDGIEEINEITGGEEASTVKNRIFTYSFSSSDIEALRRIFGRLNMGDVNIGKISNVVSDLRSIARDIKNNNRLSMEAILYGSKEINSLLNNNDFIIDRLGDVIKDVYETSEIKYKEAMKYIIENWKWIPQLNIAINACGKIKDEDLLNMISLNIVGETKFESFKALINSGCTNFISNIFKVMSEVQEGDMLSNKICKYFNQYYVINFGEEGISSARDYVNMPHLSKRAKKEISKILPKNNTGSCLTLGDMIECAKNGDIKTINNCLNEDKLRRNAYIALRWTTKNKREKAESVILNGFKNFSKLNKAEIGEGLLSLGSLNSAEVDKLAHSYIRSGLAKEYAYGALALRGNKAYVDKLINEIFESENINAYYIIKQCKKVMEDNIKDTLSDHMHSRDFNKIIKALRVSIQLCKEDGATYEHTVINGIKNIVNRYLLEEVIEEQVRIQVIRTLESIFEEKTKDRLIPILFMINDSSKASINEKASVKKLLLSVGAQLPK